MCRAMWAHKESGNIWLESSHTGTREGDLTNENMSQKERPCSDHKSARRDDSMVHMSPRLRGNERHLFHHIRKIRRWGFNLAKIPKYP